MMTFGRVVGGSHMNATISVNRKGELALGLSGLKRTPNLTGDAVASWEEIIPEARGGAAGAVSTVGQAISRAALPGRAGEAAAAAVDSVAGLVANSSHLVRVVWTDGTRSLVQLPDQLFRHLVLLLEDRQIATAIPDESPPPTPTPTVVGRLRDRARAAIGTKSDVPKQIERLAALRDRGALTDAEFAAKKAELLGSPATKEPDSDQAELSGAISTPPPPPALPPAWAPDPHGRHELRYWDGSSWTAHISNKGVQGTDTA